MRRLVLPGIPFLLSFALSLSTAGSHCTWQDSGFFLVAVKELGILYPPGFALYVLLCKAWTLALWFVDFTYAVHLFSATCAALAAGTLAVAARDLLRTKGPIFQTVGECPQAEWVGVAIGCLAASGYTFWAAAILAKVYAFYYLILTLLLWRMIRADESGRPRDFTIVAVLIGLAWQAHPSATLTGLALVLFVAFHRKVVRWKGLLWRTALAALCAIGPIHLLPLFKHAGGSAVQFGDPGSVAGFFEYLTGSRFTMKSGNFGWDGSRVASVGRFFWQEFLGVGVLLAGAGAYRLWTANRRLLAGLAAWVIPQLLVTVLFKLEGQHDFWMVASWIPFWLTAALGLTMLRRAREWAGAVALAGVLWSVVANRPDLDQRNYTLAETLGHLYLDHPDRDSTLILESDDALSTTVYLRRIRGVRPDLRLRESLNLQETTYFERPRPELEPLVPSGALFKWTFTTGNQWRVKHDVWQEPIPPEEVVKLFRRPRGQFLERIEGELQVRPEPYEKRLLRAQLLARRNFATQLVRESHVREGALEKAAELCESILTVDPSMNEEATAVFPLAVLYVGLKRYDKAESLFKKVLTLRLEPSRRAEAYYFLSLLCGERPEAAEWRKKALRSEELPGPLRDKLEGR